MDIKKDTYCVQLQHHMIDDNNNVDYLIKIIPVTTTTPTITITSITTKIASLDFHLSLSDPQSLLTSKNCKRYFHNTNAITLLVYMPTCISIVVVVIIANFILLCCHDYGKQFQYNLVVFIGPICIRNKFYTNKKQNKNKNKIKQKIVVAFLFLCTFI